MDATNTVACVLLRAITTTNTRLCLLPPHSQENLTNAPFFAQNEELQRVKKEQQQKTSIATNLFINILICTEKEEKGDMKKPEK